MEDLIHRISMMFAAIWVGYLVGFTKVAFCTENCHLGLIRGYGYVGDLRYPSTPAKLSASSTLSPTSFYSPNNVPINQKETSEHSGGWVAGKNTANEYIQAEFPGIRRVDHIMTLGREGFTPQQFVTSYRVLYSIDCMHFETLRDSNGQPMIFQGNSAAEEYAHNPLPISFNAKCMRINPVSWNNHIALRFEVIGCDICRTLEFPNGDTQVSVTDSVTTVRLTCNDGFRLVGDEVFSCLPNGSWSKDIPHCRYQGCGLNFSTQTILQGGLATFEIHREYKVRFYHLPELREQKFIAELHSSLFFLYEDDSYKGRLHSTGNDSYLVITLNGIQAQDSGTYFATTGFFATTPLCFQVTVIGPPVIHVTTLSKTGGFEEYSIGRFSCSCYSTSSSNGEEFHNTTEKCGTVMWKLDGKEVCKNMRFRLHDHDLEITDLTRKDIQNLKMLSCEITERNGGTYSSNQQFELQIFYGPDNVLVSPPNMFYILEDGDAVPNISCKADCNPPCSIYWTKIGERDVLTKIGTNILSLGRASDSVSGEYVCNATRNGSTSFRTKSVVVLLKVKPSRSGNNTSLDHSNDRITGIVGGLLGTILFLISAAFVLVCCLIYRRKQSDSACQSFQSHRKKDCSNGSTSGLRKLNGNGPCPESDGSEDASNYDTTGTGEGNAYSELNAGSRNVLLYETINAGFTEATVGAATEYENN